MTKNNAEIPENEERLVRLLKKVWDDHDFIISTMLACVECEIVDEVIELIEDNPVIDSDTISDYIDEFYDVEIVDDAMFIG